MEGQAARSIVLVTRPNDGSEPTEAPFRRHTDSDSRRPQPVPAARSPSRGEHREKRCAARRSNSGSTPFSPAKARSPGCACPAATAAWCTAKATLTRSARRRSCRASRSPPRTIAGSRAWPSAAPSRRSSSNKQRALPRRATATPTTSSPSCRAATPSAGYVMAGAHLDSWVAADGAADNAAGSAVVMEAARILSTLGVRAASARSASRCGRARSRDCSGSIAYVERHLADAPAGRRSRAGQAVACLAPGTARWPIEPQAGLKDRASAYFNIDNGSGKVRGIYAEGNVAVGADLQGVARAVREHGRDGGRRGAHRRNRSRADAADRHSGVPVHAGSARLRQPHPPHQRRQLRPPEARRPAAGRGDSRIACCGWRPSAKSRCRECRCRRSRSRPTRSSTKKTTTSRGQARGQATVTDRASGLTVPDPDFSDRARRPGRGRGRARAPLASPRERRRSRCRTRASCLRADG